MVQPHKNRAAAPRRDINHLFGGAMGCGGFLREAGHQLEQLRRQYLNLAFVGQSLTNEFDFFTLPNSARVREFASHQPNVIVVKRK